MTDETCVQSDLAHKPTRVPDGVPPLQVPTWPAPGAPRRYWTVVTHYGAADPKHRDEECGFEVYDADGVLRMKLDRDGRYVEVSRFLHGVAVGDDEEIAVRGVGVSDVPDVSDDGETDVEPVVREEWWAVEVVI